MSDLPHRTLGTSGISVSRLALGSWRTYERVPRDQGMAVMRAAREHGIDFLDDARYDDETGTAPIRTGYSEVVFGELFRASGWRRDDVVVSNKLWWELWPSQSAAEEVDGSLERMGFDHLDLVYSCPSPNEPPVEEIVEAAGGLIRSGKARAWGVCNWRPDRLAEAAEIARREGVPPPCAAQLPYSLTAREDVDGPAAVDAIERSGVSVVASFALSGGILSGKYVDRATAGRMSGELDDAHSEAALRAATDLRELADRLDAAPAALAIAFAAGGQNVASVLFGATTSEQVAENVAAIDLLDRLTPAELSELRAIGGVS